MNDSRDGSYSSLEINSKLQKEDSYGSQIGNGSRNLNLANHFGDKKWSISNPDELVEKISEYKLMACRKCN